MCGGGLLSLYYNHTEQSVIDHISALLSILMGHAFSLSIGKRMSDVVITTW